MNILQELTDQMRAFVEEYEKNADGKIDIIEVWLSYLHYASGISDSVCSFCEL